MPTQKASMATEMMTRPRRVLRLAARTSSSLTTTSSTFSADSSSNFFSSSKIVSSAFSNILDCIAENILAAAV